MDLTRYQRRLDFVGKKNMVHNLALNLYLYPFPPVSSFGSCGHHISFFSELSIPSCIVVKIATGSVSSSPSATILRHQKTPPPPP